MKIHEKRNCISTNVSFLKKIVCPSVCLTFFESADARDLGLMTLFPISAPGAFEIEKRYCYFTFQLAPSFDL